VELQQSELFIEKARKAGLECKLIVKKGAAHGWPDLEKDLIQFADWFEEHLKKPADAGLRKAS